MPEPILQSLEVVARGLKIVGAGALFVGFVIATVHFVSRYFREGLKPAVARYRKAIGRVVLIGLEILVAATIINTITVDPTVEGMGFLAIMVAIRTALGWAMSLEINGRWPWQKPQQRAGVSKGAQ